MTDEFTQKARDTHFPREVTPERAMEAALRLIGTAFYNPNAERPHFTIPTNPDDDDVVLVDYIRQTRSAAGRDEWPPPSEAAEITQLALRKVKELLQRPVDEHTEEVRVPLHQLSELRTILRSAVNREYLPICIGHETIRRLREEGSVTFEGGQTLVAASDLYAPPDAKEQG